MVTLFEALDCPDLKNVVMNSKNISSLTGSDRSFNPHVNFCIANYRRNSETLRRYTLSTVKGI